MPRVKGGSVTRRRRKKILKLAKGYVGSRRLLYRTAHEQVMKALQNAYKDRKRKKREFRKLWISRINAAAKANGTKYSLLIHGLALANVQVNRKMLAEIAIHAPQDFTKYVEIANAAINTGATKPKKEIKKLAPLPVEAVKAEPKKEVKKTEVKEEVKKETPVKPEKPVKKPIVDEEDPTIVYETEEEIELAMMLVTTLKERAKSLGIENADGMRKAEIIKAITNIPLKEKVPYEKLLVKVLREDAVFRGIDGAQKMLKADLVKALYADDKKNKK